MIVQRKESITDHFALIAPLQHLMRLFSIAKN